VHRQRLQASQARPLQVDSQLHHAAVVGRLLVSQAALWPELSLLQFHLVQVQVGLLQVLLAEQVGAPLAEQHRLPMDCWWSSSTWMIRPKVWTTWTERIQTSLESALTSTTLHQMNRSKGWIRRSSLARSSRVCC